MLNYSRETIRDAVRAFAPAERWPDAAQRDKEPPFPAEVRSDECGTIGCPHHVPLYALGEADTC